MMEKREGGKGTRSGVEVDNGIGSVMGRGQNEDDWRRRVAAGFGTVKGLRAERSGRRKDGTNAGSFVYN